MKATKREKATVVFQPSGKRGEVKAGLSIVEASREVGVDIESLCGEKKVCGKCKVQIEEGRFEKYGITSSTKNLSAWQEEEGKFITTDERARGFRLGCCARVQDDVLVFVPEESRAGKQVVSKGVRKIPIKHNPAVKYYYVEMNPPSIEDPLGDFERLCKAIEGASGLKNLRCDYRALCKLSEVLREGQWKVTVSLWMDQEIIRIVPGKVGRHYGLAVDIGTTTVAGYLCDLSTMEVLGTSSLMNPQIRYGEDVMSRITFHATNPGGLKRMSEDIIEALNTVIEDVRGPLQARGEDIEDMVLVGNTAMHHILLQLDPEFVAQSPFPPALHHSLDIKARDLGLKINESAYVHFLPIEAGFVGADNVAVLICEEPYRGNPIQLIIDIGTNGELVLGNKHRLLSCSCATGPAFEGAQLSCGMRAAPGAIERIKISPEDHEVDYKVIGRDSWKSFSKAEEMRAKGICGSGVLDLLAELYLSGVITKNGSFAKSQKSNRFRANPETQQSEFVIAWRQETSIDKDIAVTQKDIRQIQLGKAALYTGCKLMFKRMGIQKPDVVKIAGAFGIHVDPFKALIMGLFPDCEVEKIFAIGNAAGDGARIALLNREKRFEADWVARHAEYVELTLEPTFQDEFMKALHIPHMTDGYPSLRGFVPDEVLYQK